MKNRIKQILFWLPMTIVGLCLGAFLIMWISTAPVINEVKSVMRGQVEFESIQGTPLERYYICADDATVSVSMERLFVLCGPRRGCMWVLYSYEAKNRQGDIGTASHGVVSHWEIEKIDGKWKITSISESP